MKIAIAGGSGFIGNALTESLQEDGHHVFILTRNGNRKPERNGITYIEWLTENSYPEKYLNGIDAIVNLAGQSINSGRWTQTKKEEILYSRLEATKEVVRIIDNLDNKPKTLINGSAIGFYGTSLEDTFTENSTGSGEDFLATVVKEWEKEAAKAKEMTRVVFTRFGMVLDKNEGALVKMLLPFKMFVGGNLGSGKQWMSWVHIDDVARAIIHCIENDEFEGPVNVTAPEPVIMKDFGKTLASALHRPYWAPVPAFVLKAALGEMSLLVLEGQKVIPKKLLDSQFTFNYPKVDSALNQLLV